MLSDVNNLNETLENAAVFRETTEDINQLHLGNQPEGTRKAYAAKVALFKVNYA
jgi:hypothetical protein